MDSVKVAIRVRPLIAREQGSEILWTTDTHHGQIKLKEGKAKPYVFDRVFDSKERTGDVYQEIVEPIVQSAMDGFNGTVFAYGQTSSGKTYTMMGNRQNPGIIPLSIRETFAHIQTAPEREFILRISYMEIYNEVIRDLLVPSSDGPGLQIREDEFRNVVVQGLTENPVLSADEVLGLMMQGDKRRQTGSTNMNERSSRSHTIFRMIIESRERADANTTGDSIENDTAIKVSQLNLVDLAGSERAGQTGAEGQRFKEGCHINKSLSTLGLVINQICKTSEGAQPSQFISYRDSKLTRILQPSLGGNSLTAIICAVTPISCDDTDGTLRFANNAKKIKNNPHVNEVLSDEALLYRQKREINQLKKKIQELVLNTGKKQTEELETLLEKKNKLQQEQEEKIQTLKNIILVSTQPADAMKMKRQRAMRRETWCPGKLAGGPLSQPPWMSPRKDLTLENKSLLFQTVDQMQTRCEFEPTGPKRARFMDETVFFTPELKAPGLNQQAEEASMHFSTLEEELVQMRKRQEELEEELAEAVVQKNKHIRENDSRKVKVMQMQGQISAQQETIDLILDEKSQLEEEKNTMEAKLKAQNKEISDYMKRERQWENSNPDIRGLQNEKLDLCEQLSDVCAQNRRLQEKSDDYNNTIDMLQSSLEVIEKEMKEKEDSLEEYKQQVSTLQLQLETSSASNSGASTSNSDAGKLEEELKVCRQELEEARRGLFEEAVNKESASVGSDTVENLCKELALKNEEIAGLKRVLSDKSDAEKSVNGNVQVGENTFADYLTASEALIEERDLVKNENNKLKEEIENLRSELEEARMDAVDDSLRAGEKTMAAAVFEYEELKYSKEAVDTELERAKQDVADMKASCDQIEQKMSEMIEHEEFLKAEKEMLFEQERENMAEIESLKKELEIEKMRTDEVKALPLSVNKDDSEVHELREENFTLLKSSEDAQVMMREANKNLAVANTTVESQKTEIENLEKERDRARSDIESFEAVAGLTKQKYEQRIEELTQQLQSAYDQIGDGQAPSRVEEAPSSPELKIVLEQKDSEIENLTVELTSTSSKLQELESVVVEYKKKLESFNLQLGSSEQDSTSQDLGKFLEENCITLDGLRAKLDAVASLQEENFNILADVQQRSGRILELEEQLRSSKEELESLQRMRDRICEMEKGILDRDAKLEELEKSSKETSCSVQWEDFEKMRASFEEKEIEKESLTAKLTAAEELLAFKNEEVKNLSVDLASSIKKQEELGNQLEDAVAIQSTEDGRNLRERLSDARKELLETREKYEKLNTDIQHAQGALLAETNRDLDQQRLLQNAERQKRESALEIASERESANKHINQLLAKVSELQTALCRANVDRDVAVRQSNKMTQECEFLRQQVKDLEGIHKEASVIPRAQAMDPDKMAEKIKQLTFNSELTKQISDKLTNANKALQEDNKRLESEVVRVMNLEGEVARLEAILEQERKTREENAARLISREKESSEMRERIVELQKSLKEAECNFEKRSSEAFRDLHSLLAEKKVLLEEGQHSNERISTLETVIQDQENKAKEAVIQMKQSRERAEELQAELEMVKIGNAEAQMAKESLQERLDHVIKNLEKEKEKSSKFEEDNEAIISDLDKIREELQEKEKTLKETASKNILLRQSMDQLRDKLEIAKQETEKVRSEILAGELSEKEVMAKELQDLQTILSQKDKEKVELSERIAEIMMENKDKGSEKDAHLKQLQEECNALIQERDSLQMSSAELEKIVADKNSQLDCAIASSSDKQGEIEEMKERNDLLQNRIEELESKMAEKFQEQDSQESIEGEMNYKILMEQCNILSQDRDSLLDRVRELEVALALKEEESELGNVSGTSNRVEEFINKIADLESELEKVILDKEEVSKILDNERQKHENILQRLKDSSANKEDSQVREEVDALRNQLSEREEEVVRFRNLIQDLEKKCTSLEKDRLLKVQKQSTESDDGIGFAADLDEALIENLTDQVAELKVQLEEKEELIEDLKRSVESLRSADRALDQQNESCAKMVQEEAENLARELDEMTAMLPDTRSEQISNLLPIEAHSRQMQEKDEDLGANELSRVLLNGGEIFGRVEDGSSSRGNLENVENLHLKIAELKKYKEEKDAEILKLKRLNEEAEARISDLAYQKEQVEILSRKQEKYKSEIAALESLLAAEKEAMSEVRQQLLDLRKSLEKEDARIVEDKKSKEEVDLELESARKENDSLVQQLEQMTRRKNSLEEGEKIETDPGIQDNCKVKEQVNACLEEECSNLRDTVSLLEKRIKESVEEVGKLQQRVSTLQKTKEELEAEKQDLLDQMSELRAKLELINQEDPKTDKITQLEADVDEWKKRASNLEQELNELYEMIRGKAALMEETAASREVLEKNADHLQEENENLQRKVLELEERAMFVSEEMEEATKKTHERIQDLTQEVSALKESKDSVIFDAGKLKEEKMTFQNEMMEAVNRIQELEQENARKAELEVEVRDSENRVKKLSEELAKMTELRDSFEHRLKDFKKTESTLTESMEDNRKRIQGLKTDLEEMTQSNGSLKLLLDDVGNEKATLEEKIKIMQDEHQENLKREEESKESLQKEVDAFKKHFDFIVGEKEKADEQVSELTRKIEELSKKMQESSVKKDAEEVESLRAQLASTKGEMEKELEEVKGLLYKKELEVQTLESQISKWERRHDQDKADLETAVKLAKDEISSQNEKNLMKICELEKTLAEARQSGEAMTLSLSDAEAKFRDRLEKEKAKSKRLSEEITELESEYKKQLADSEQKAKDSRSELFKKIDSLEQGLFEEDQEKEQSKKRFEELQMKMKEMEERLEDGGVRTRSGENAFQQLKAAFAKSELKCKEEKQKTQALTARLKTEKQRGNELFRKLENATVRFTQNKPVGADPNYEVAKDLFLERQKTKELQEKLDGCDKEFSKRMERSQEQMQETKTIMRKRIDELEDNCMEMDGELEEGKKKCNVLEEKIKTLELRIEAMKSTASAKKEQALQKEVNDRDVMIMRLEVKMKSAVDPLQRELKQLKEELKMSEERLSTWKLNFLPASDEGPKTRSKGGSRTTRGATAKQQFYSGGSSGLVVQDTKVYILEMEITDSKNRIKYLEKELAKYMDIETKRRAENLELLEENKKYRSVIKKAREKKYMAAEVLSENADFLNQPTPTASDAQTEPVETTYPHERCKSQ